LRPSWVTTESSRRGNRRGSEGGITGAIPSLAPGIHAVVDRLVYLVSFPIVIFVWRVAPKELCVRVNIENHAGSAQDNISSLEVSQATRSNSYRSSIARKIVVVRLAVVPLVAITLFSRQASLRLRARQVPHAAAPPCDIAWRCRGQGVQSEAQNREYIAERTWRGRKAQSGVEARGKQRGWPYLPALRIDVPGGGCPKLTSGTLLLAGPMSDRVVNPIAPRPKPA